MKTRKKKTVTEQIIEYGDQKYGKPIGLVLLIKVHTVVSLQNKNGLPPLSVITIAPSGHLKSRTSIETIDIFPDLTSDLGSDMTMNNLIREEEQKRIRNRTMLINDLTLLFSSKRDTTKSRLCNGLAELLSEGTYTYRDFKETTLIQARTNLITNITDNSFQHNKNTQFIGNTFLERLLPIHYSVSLDNQKAFNQDRDKRISMKLGITINIKPRKVRVKKEHEEEINKLSISLMENVEGKSFNRACDKVKVILVSNALLNRRNCLNKDDFEVCEKLINLTIDTGSFYNKILYLAKSGLNVEDIAEKLNCSKKTVYKHLEKVREIRSRGDLYS